MRWFFGGLLLTSRTARRAVYLVFWLAFGLLLVKFAPSPTLGIVILVLLGVWHVGRIVRGSSRGPDDPTDWR